MGLSLSNVIARDLPDAWFQLVFKILEEGKVFTIDEGSYAGQKRLEFDYITIHILHPNSRPLLPHIEKHFNIPNPSSDDYLDEYCSYLMTPVVKANESYTYGQRLTKYPIPEELLVQMLTKGSLFYMDKECWDNPDIIIRENDKLYLNQIEWLIWTYKNKGFRNNQMVLQIAHPIDMILQDPSCLREIDTRIQDGKVHFFIEMRSWDLWNGLPNNLAVIQLLKEYIGSCIGIQDGEIIARSKGLHIYDYSFDTAKIIRMKESIKLKSGE